MLSFEGSMIVGSDAGGVASANVPLGTVLDSFLFKESVSTPIGFDRPEVSFLVGLSDLVVPDLVWVGGLGSEFAYRATFSGIRSMMRIT